MNNNEVGFNRRMKSNQNKNGYCQECFYSYFRCQCDSEEKRHYKRMVMHKGDNKYCQKCYKVPSYCKCVNLLPRTQIKPMKEVDDVSVTVEAGESVTLRFKIVDDKIIITFD